MKALTPKQLETAALLASGTSITEAAIKAEIARQTVHDWLNEPCYLLHTLTA